MGVPRESGKPIIIAGAGLLSQDNIAALELNAYSYILGARPKNIVFIKFDMQNYNFYLRKPCGYAREHKKQQISTPY